MPKHTHNPTPGIGMGPGPLAGLHGFGTHLPPLPGIPTSIGGVHPTPLSALTAAARSAPVGVPVSSAGSNHGGLLPPPPGVAGGGGTMGPIRRRLTEKAPLPMTNGEKNEIHFFLSLTLRHQIRLHHQLTKQMKWHPKVMFVAT